MPTPRFLLAVARKLGRRSSARPGGAGAGAADRLTIENAPVGMTMVDLEHRFVEPNAHLCTLFGYSAAELAEMTFEQVTHPDDLHTDLQLLEQLSAGRIDSYEIEKRYVRRHGAHLWCRLTVSLVRDQGGSPRYFVSQVQDVSAVHQAGEETRGPVLYDVVTGLPNRNLLMDRLTAAVRTSDTGQSSAIGVAFCDVDNYQQVNDTFGHGVGDLVLQEVARRLKDAVRAGDTVARMGGAEFVLLLAQVESLDEATRILDGALRAVAQPLVVDDRTLQVGLSGGLALGHPGDPVGTLLRKADIALVAAKDRGGGTAVTHHAALGADRSTRVRVGQYDEMQSVIRDALLRDRIELDYQPVYDLSTGLVVGTEALLRLRDAKGRRIQPLDVIPAAEASGLIIDVGRRVLQMAAIQSARWSAEHGIQIPIAVNVSAVQLAQPGFSDELFDVMRQAGVAPGALSLELTESVLLEAGLGGMERLIALCDAGIELAIDDFGTGYASLSYLHDLPASTVKIDRSFVNGIPEDHRAVAIVAGVIALAENFGMTCIAEGIENESQRAYLAERGILGQGYLLGRPDLATTIDSLVGSGRAAAHLSTSV